MNCSIFTFDPLKYELDLVFYQKPLCEKSKNLFYQKKRFSLKNKNTHIIVKSIHSSTHLESKCE